MPKHSDDILLVKKLREGDILAFDNIFNKYNKKVFYFTLSYLKNKEESEDVVQEVFMNLWKCREQINEYYVFSKYLFKIAYNATCKKLRKQLSDKKQLEEIFQNIAREDNTTDLEIEFDNLLENANLIIEKLPSRQKEIFLLSINKHLTNEQIAKQLKISKKTVENYIAIAKTCLRKSFYEDRIITLLLFLLLLKL